jgi:hypothetical protein
MAVADVSLLAVGAKRFWILSPTRAALNDARRPRRSLAAAALR